METVANTFLQRMVYYFQSGAESLQLFLTFSDVHSCGTIIFHAKMFYKNHIQVLS